MTNVGKLFLTVVPLKLTNAFTQERNRTGVTNVGKLFLKVVALNTTNAFTLHRVECFSEPS